jgi:hypothetical protein|tara:strand:- start:36 stop:338 length:303 start_codon:yes stop_codon:yes gene_type:complete
MENIYYLLGLCLICWYFVYIRKVSEAALKHCQQYCQNEELQFIAIARRSSRFKFTKKEGFYLFSLYDFEFSGDGDSCYQGQVSLKALKLDRVELPAYRVH